MGVKVREKVKGSGCFWVFINHQGKRVSRQVGSKATAEKVAEQIQAKLTLGQDALPKPKPKLPTLEQYYQHIRRTYLQTATRPTTLESYRSSFEIHILPKLGSKRLDELSKVHIRNLIAGLVRADLAKASIQVIVAKLCAVLNHAVEDELILRNPATKCAKFYKQARIRNREIQPLNPEKAALFLKTICNREISRRYYPLFLTALHTGMRSSELAALQWGDIDFNGKFLTVRRT